MASLFPKQYPHSSLSLLAECPVFPPEQTPQSSIKASPPGSPIQSYGQGHPKGGLLGSAQILQLSNMKEPPKVPLQSSSTLISLTEYIAKSAPSKIWLSYTDAL